MPAFKDQTGRTVDLATFPSRIVSIVPSQTELLYDLGLDEHVAGITKFCVHPAEWFHTKTRVGGTKKLHLNTIHSLQPDLIIANKEENTKDDVEALAASYPVWISDISSLEDALEMISQVGAMTGTVLPAGDIIKKIKDGFQHLQESIKNTEPVPAAYLIWNDPLMITGGDTFIDAMMKSAGFENVFSNKSRYPVITKDDIRYTGCKALLLSSEPYPFKQKHVDHFRDLLPGIDVLLVDGQMFSWYGSRLQYAPRYFERLHKGFS